MKKKILAIVLGLILLASGGISQLSADQICGCGCGHAVIEGTTHCGCGWKPSNA